MNLLFFLLVPNPSAPISVTPTHLIGTSSNPAHKKIEEKANAENTDKATNDATK